MENILEDLEILILQNEDDFDRGKGVIILREFIKEQKDKLRLNGVGVQIEQLKCECKRPQFTRTVTEDYEPMCGRCGNPL